MTGVKFTSGGGQTRTSLADDVAAEGEPVDLLVTHRAAAVSDRQVPMTPAARRLVASPADRADDEINGEEAEHRDAEQRQHPGDREDDGYADGDAPGWQLLPGPAADRGCADGCARARPRPVLQGPS
jgi:hypothetical protein